MSIKLSIVMACCDDFYGVQSTVLSLIAQHGVYRSRDDIEIIVVDNNPSSEHGMLTKKWVTGRTKATYIPYELAKGTAQPREIAIQNAVGKFVLCIDCHVTLYPGVLHQLLAYIDKHPDTPNLLQGPLATDSGTRYMGTHQRPEWGSGSYGKWAVKEGFTKPGLDDRIEPFEIWQQGLGLFCFKRSEWVGFHPDFRGFGGCETYIAESFRRKGAKVLCLPFLVWTHRFAQLDRGYKADKYDQLRNYAISFITLDMPLDGLMNEFNVTEETVRLAASDARQLDKPTPVPNNIPAKSLKVAVTGCSKFGPVKMRAVPLASEFGYRHYSSTKMVLSGEWDVIIAVKDIRPSLRQHCKRLILDPCDVFFNEASKHRRAADYWRRIAATTKYDEIVSTSPACSVTMQEAYPSAPVHLVPHHCDPKLSGTRDIHGPVVYSGQGCFIKARVEDVKKACRAIGKELVCGFSSKAAQWS